MAEEEVACQPFLSPACLPVDGKSDQRDYEEGLENYENQKIVKSTHYFSKKHKR